jgi:signal peptidase I
MTTPLENFMLIHPAPRKPLFALLMSFVLPGFGQLYNGQPEKALRLFLAFAVLAAPGVALVALYLPSALTMAALILGLALSLGLWLYAMVDAWREARRQPDYRPRAWQTPGLYVLVLLLCDGLALPLLTDYVRSHQVESFYIPSTSMTPGLLRGDILFADKRYNCPGCKHAIRRGDMAIFTYPNERTRLYIKRIVGLPGDRVTIEHGAVAVNGQALAGNGDVAERVEALDGRSWTVRGGMDAEAPVDVVVPPGQVFVLGDNRADSKDSRHFGTVPMADVVGRARQLWFSKGEGGVRWERLGRVID